jgi:hypothetical protein
MMTERIERKAKKGKFLVVGEDTFRTPPDEYIVAKDVSRLEKAKKKANEEAGEMNPVMVYDDQEKRFIMLAPSKRKFS